MNTFNQVPEEKKEIILDYLKKKMKKQELNHYDISNDLGVSQPTIWRYFSGVTEMPLMTYLDICSLLKIKPTKPIKKAFNY